MSNNQNALANINGLPATVGSLVTRSISMFSRRIKSLWVLMILITFVAELIPIPPMPYLLFYLCYALKVAVFFAVGFLSPLAFHRLSGIGLGFFFSLLSAFLIEVFQSLSHNGHSFHLHELAGKLTVITIGFAFALERRYERRISFGPVDISLRTNDL